MQLSTAFEFEGVDGQIRTFYGCSLVGRFEFFDRLAAIQILLKQAGSRTIEEF